MAWHSLPDFIRDPTSSTDCFRRLLKAYVFALYQCIQLIRGYALYKSTHALTHSLRIRPRRVPVTDKNQAVIEQQYLVFVLAFGDEFVSDFDLRLQK